jgi:ubiquinone/menaquinone biosynthesis C-methylase UbiE
LNNLNRDVVKSFGEEWSHFNQSSLSDDEAIKLFNRYFSIFPSSFFFQSNKIGIDVGCGSGRWAKFIAPKVKKLYCIDASEKSINVARKNLAKHENVVFHNFSTDDLATLDLKFDFGYSIGVLHHIPDTQKALNDCVLVLRDGAPFLIYLYFAFDNKPFWYKALWKLSEPVRYIISRSNFKTRKYLTTFIAIFIYFPIARLALIFDKLGIDSRHIPLSAYKKTSFYTMRTDALDRFGTILEQRFTKQEIYSMMEDAGLTDIVFSKNIPYWTVVGYKKSLSSIGGKSQ